VLSYSDARSFAAWLVGYGADVEVLDPPEVRTAVIERLEEIAKAQDTSLGNLGGIDAVGVN
jgi:proteasome accessory factor B